MTRSRLSTVALLAGASTAALAAAGTAYADSTATGSSSGSPGLLSGNSVQAPVEVPVNVCGNSANGIGALNPAFGNHCANTESPAAAPVSAAPRTTPVHHLSPPPAPVHTAAAPTVRHDAPPPLAASDGPVASDGPQLAETGAGPEQLAGMSGLGAVLLAGGALLLRRGRRTTE